jgi:hypothetical protein
MKPNITRILAYGCSYTTGDEIMDHVTMNVSFDECNKIKRRYIQNDNSLDAKIKFKNDHNIWTTDKELNYNHTWVAYLARHLNLPFKNKAMNGSSLDQIYFSIYRDLVNGLILETDIVLVGLTSPFRIIDFRNVIEVKTVLPHHLNQDKVGSKMLVDLFNDDFSLFQYYKIVESLHNLNSKINIRLQPMEPIPPLERATGGYKLIHTRSVCQSMQTSSLPSMLLPKEYLKLPIIDGKEKRCEYGHPPLESHIELAEKIYNQIEF